MPSPYLLKPVSLLAPSMANCSKFTSALLRALGRKLSPTSVCLSITYLFSVILAIIIIIIYRPITICLAN